MDNETETTNNPVKRPARIEVRSKDHNDLNFLELREFYRNLQKKDKELKVNYTKEKSQETENYIHIDFYSQDGESLDAVMIPYRVGE